MTNGCSTLVLPGDVIYDIVNQIKDVGSYKVEDNNDSFRIEFSLDYTPAIPLPVKLYLRWKLPGGRLV